MNTQQHNSSGCLHQPCSGLLADLKRHRAQMAPHQKDRDAGRLLLRSIDVLEFADSAFRALCDELRARAETARALSLHLDEPLTESNAYHKAANRIEDTLTLILSQNA